MVIITGNETQETHEKILKMLKKASENQVKKENTISTKSLVSCISHKLSFNTTDEIQEQVSIKKKVNSTHDIKKQ